jgi:hypothetical protein
MLRTNSKKASENVKAYILDNFVAEYADDTVNPENFHQVASAIYADYFRVIKDDYRYKKHNMSMQDLFEDWASGLPGILDTGYYYNRSALKDLANILEETEAEAGKYTESDAEKLLSYLIYREISKAVAA